MEHNKNQGSSHHNREDLTGEHFIGDLGQLILLVLFLTVWIADSFFLHYSTFLSEHVSSFIQIPVSLGILFYSGYLAKTGLKIVFGEVRDTPSVIRKGVFNTVRHPIYLGAILLYLGLIVLSFSLLSVIIWIIIIIFYHLIARYEEKLLLQKFGKDYEQYIKDVPMWIPYLK